MFKRLQSFLLRDSGSPKIPLLFGLIFLIIYLTARNSGLYPMIFGDEWLYNAYSRFLPADTATRPSYFYYALYELTNYCGDAFLDCARQINVLFFALSLPIIYSVSRRFASVNLSVFVSLCAVFSPVNAYSVNFMPESMNYFFFWLFTWFVVRGYETKPALMAAGAGIVLACMSMVKPHAIFLFPALFVAFFSGWIFDRNAHAFKHACRLAVISIAAFFLVRLPLGYILAGTHGLSIMGSDYGGYARTMREPSYFINLLSLARHHLWGQFLGITIMFGVPLALILQTPLKKSADCSESECKLRFLMLYAVSLLMTLMIIIALFSASAVSMGPYESIERLSLRHYNFTFPLLLIIAAASLTDPIKNTFSAIKTKWLAIGFAGLAAYATVTKLSPFTPHSNDTPELFAFTSNTFIFFCLGGGIVICLLLMAYRVRQGVALYLLAFFPVTIIISAILITKAFSPRMSPDVYDQAGQFANRYLGKDTAKLVIFGPDLASLLRAIFYMSTPHTLYFAVPNGQNIDTQLKPLISNGGQEWLLLIGDYKYSFDPKEKIHIPVKNVSGGVAGDYTLISYKRECDSSSPNLDRKTISSVNNFEVAPSPSTPHTAGKFDPTMTSMVAEKGESGAIIYGPYVKLQAGCYAVTYHVTAESEIEGTEVGTLDVEGYIPPNVDEKLAYTSLKSVHGEQTIKLSFKAVNPEYLYQFRVWANGNGRVSIKNIQVERFKE